MRDKIWIDFFMEYIDTFPLRLYVYIVNIILNDINLLIKEIR